MNWYSIISRHFLTWIFPLMLLSLQVTTCPGQESGYPFIKNFSAQDYKAHPQNFAISGGDDGLMYFANFAGVLQYDGHYWRLISTGKTSRFTSLATDSHGVIQCGAYGEFGHLNIDPKGNMGFENFVLKEKSSQAIDKESIATYCTPDGTYFITSNALINETSQKVWFPGDQILTAFYVDGKLYFQLKNRGLVTFKNNSFSAINGGQVFSGAFVVSSILKLDQNRILIATSTQGLYVLDENNAKPFASEADETFRSGIITCGIALKDYGFAFGTARNGIIVLNKEGRILQIVNKKAGMNDDNVHQLYYDKNGVLWAALNNGIAMMEIPAALNYFDEKAGLDGGVNAICRFQGSLYVATYQGLFVLDNAKRSFQGIPGIKTACWSLLQSGNDLFAGSSEGLYLVKGNSASKIYEDFCLSLASDPTKTGLIYIGTPNGLFQLSSLKGKPTPIAGINEEVNGLVCDGQGKIWGTQSSDKVFQYDPDLMKVIIFDSTSGLPETTGATLELLNKNCLLMLKSGQYEYQVSEHRFKHIRLTDSTTNLGDWFSILQEDKHGQLWVCSGDQKNIRRLVKKSTMYSTEQSEFLPVSEMVTWFIYPDPTGLTWFGGPDGLICYNPDIQTNTSRSYPVKLRMISLLNDSVLFFGNTIPAGTKEALDYPAIQYQFNTIRFDFASPFFTARGMTLYQYKLEGFDDTWSDWTTAITKEYTNLSHGAYNFRVRAKNVYGKVSEEQAWAFHVLPPLYLQWWAYVLYFLFTASLFYLIVRIRSSQLRKEKKILEQKIEERTAEVTRQKEEIEQQSEELSHKNSELEKINKLVKSINSEINFNSLLQSLLEKMRMIHAVERASALVFDESEQIFKYKAAFGWDFSQLEPIKLTASDSEQRFLAGAEEVYEDIFLKTNFKDLSIEPFNQKDLPKSILVVVIKIKDRIEAYLILENMVRDDAFDNKDLSFIQHSKEHIISAFIKTKILEDLQNTLDTLKEAQDQLVQSEKLASLGQLTAGIAHEIQNPLNFVNNFSALSMDLAKELKEYITELKDVIDKDKFLDIEDVVGMIEGNVEKINAHGKRASSIVKGMLQHSRGRSGEFEEVDINTLVEEYINLAYHGMRAKDSSFNTKITTNYDPEAGKLSVVPQDISRVFLNIMNNSCYAVGEKSKKVPAPYAPEVIISTKRLAAKVEIRIKDNGTGIPKSALEKIFNPFFTTKPTGQGTGLGLSMSFDIVNQVHKGRLEVNTEEGEFTEFVITLPEKR